MREFREANSLLIKVRLIMMALALALVALSDYAYPRSYQGVARRKAANWVVPLEGGSAE